MQYIFLCSQTLGTTEQKHLQVKSYAMLPGIPVKSPCHVVRSFFGRCWSSPRLGVLLLWSPLVHVGLLAGLHFLSCPHLSSIQTQLIISGNKLMPLFWFKFPMPYPHTQTEIQKVQTMAWLLLCLALSASDPTPWPSLPCWLPTLAM